MIIPGFINVAAKIPNPAPGILDVAIFIKLGTGNFSGSLVPTAVTTSGHGSKSPCSSQTDGTKSLHLQQSEGGRWRHEMDRERI